jgi:outer membrane protein assembly factor BamB
VANGVVYANSVAGRLDAFDEFTGTGKWSYAIGSLRNSTAGSYVLGPTVANEVVYDAADGAVYAIDATSGTKLWSTSGPQIPVSLAVAGGVVYLTEATGALWAFDAATGALLWTRNVGGFGGRTSAVANGVVYVSATGSANLYAFNATSGVSLWQTLNGNDSMFGGGGSPAITNGVVYVTSDSTLSAFDATTGTLLWSATTGSACATCPFMNSPAIANGIVYTSAYDGTLSAFNATTGAPLWSTASGTVGVSPVVANGVVYVGGDDGGLDAFDADTGTKLWKLPVAGTDNWPVVDDGIVFAGSSDGHLYAYDLPGSGAGLTVSPTFPPDYGTLLDGTSSAPTTFTVTNFGSDATTAMKATFTGPDSSQFHITSNTCAGKSLAGSASCNVQVAFAPTLPGVQEATLAVSAATGGSASATLSGTGNAFTVRPQAKDYGTRLDDTSSPPTTFTVTNQSSVTVSPAVASLAGSQFTERWDTCSGGTLASGATCTIGVSFTPTGFGSTSATLWATAVGVTARSALSGTASGPIAIVPRTKDYGTVPVGSSSSATLTMTNVSSATPSAPLVVNVSGSGFSIASDGCNGQTLALGASCTVVVTFAPSVSGMTYNGQLSLSMYYLGTINQATLVGIGG